MSPYPSQGVTPEHSWLRSSLGHLLPQLLDAPVPV